MAAAAFLPCACIDAAVFDVVFAVVETDLLAADLATLELALTAAFPLAVDEAARLALPLPAFELPLEVIEPVKLPFPVTALPLAVDEPFAFASFLSPLALMLLLAAALPLIVAAWLVPA
jgi:hypothetical protein